VEAQPHERNCRLKVEYDMGAPSCSQWIDRYDRGILFTVKFQGKDPP
jgi:hypothetical protein